MAHHRSHLKNGNVDGGRVQQLLLQLEVERLAVLWARAAPHDAALLHLRSFFKAVPWKLSTLITLVALLRLTLTKVSGARSSLWVRDL